MKIRIVTIALTLGVSLCPPLARAQSSALPPDSKSLMDKLAEFETEEQRKVDAAVAEKREQVVEALQQHLDRETRSGNLAAAVAVSEAITRLGGSSGTLPSQTGVIVEELTAPSTVLWEWNQEVKFKEGAASATTDGAELVFKQPLNGDFTLTLQIERAGSHVWQQWGFAVALLDTGVVAGLILGRNGEDTVFINPAAVENAAGKSSDRGVESKSGIASDPSAGQFIITRKGDRVTAVFENSSGRRLTTPSVKLNSDLATRIRIRWGGTETTPRRIHRIEIRRG